MQQLNLNDPNTIRNMRSPECESDEDEEFWLNYERLTKFSLNLKQ